MPSPNEPFLRVYKNFDLLIERADQGYRARVLASPVGEASTLFTLPFSAAQLKNSLMLLGGLIRDDRAFKFGGEDSAESQPPLDPKRFGALLFQAVFADKVGVCLQRSLDAARAEGKGLRIRLRLTDAPELAALPWEYLFDAEHNRFPILSEQTPLVRYLELPLSEQPLLVQPTLRLLVMISDPTDVAPRLKVEREWLRLTEALAALIERKAVIVERLPHATLAELQRALRQGEVHLFHFIGHGWFDETTGTGGLLLEDDEGNRQPVTVDRLSPLLHDHRPLRLAFLNACEGAQADHREPFAGVAQHLVQQGLPAVIAMQFAVTDRAAIALAENFYQALADGYPVDAALAEARKAIYAQGSALEWGTPVLFSRSDDNQLFLPLPPSHSPTFERKPFEPETILIPAGPFLMGSGDDSSAEKPQHTVTLPASRVGKTPITNRQYAEFLKRNKKQEEPKRAGWFLRQPPPDKLDHPVVGVSWHDARAYTAWLSQETGRPYRLPTEAEWEKAARGPDGLRYPWGDEWVDNHCNVGGNDTTSVTAYPDGASPYGCLDLVGNGQEWTQTIWGADENRNDYPYPYDPNDGREDLDARQYAASVLRVHRGGSFRSQASQVRCSARAGSDQETKVTWRGFRVVMEI